MQQFISKSIDRILEAYNNFTKLIKTTFYDTEIKKTNTLFILAIILLTIFFFYRYESRNHIINGNSLKDSIDDLKSNVEYSKKAVKQIELLSSIKQGSSQQQLNKSILKLKSDSFSKKLQDLARCSAQIKDKTNLTQLYYADIQKYIQNHN